MPSRRTFKDRILREVAAFSGAISSLEQQILDLPDGSTVTSTATLPIVDGVSGGAVRVTASNLRDYILGIAGGIANIPEPLVLASTLVIGSTVTQNGLTAYLAQATTNESRVYVGAGTGVYGTQVVVRAAAGYGAGFEFYTGTDEPPVSTASRRWSVYKNGDAESGSNAGSGFRIRAYTDAGVLIDDPVSITRASGGVLAIARPTTMSSTLAVTTSVTVPLLTNAGALNIRTTGANALTLGTDSVTRLTIASGGGATFSSTLDVTTSLTTPLITRAGAIDIRTTTGTSLTLGTNNTTRLTVNLVGRALFTGQIIATGADDPVFNVIEAGSDTRAGTTVMAVNAAAGQFRYFQFMNALQQRWSFGANGTAESGSNAGSDFRIASYTDGGVLIDDLVSIVRAAGGAITLGSTGNRQVVIAGSGWGGGAASLRLNGLTSGAGAGAGTLTNAPAAGDPNFWLPVSIDGVVRYVPCW